MGIVLKMQNWTSSSDGASPLVIGRSGPKPERPQSYPAPSRCGPSRSGPIGRCGPSRSGPTGSMRPQSIRPHFTQKTFYQVRLTYHGLALVDPAPLCIRYISLVILPSYLRLTMVRSWSIRSHFANKTYLFGHLTELPLTYDGPVLVDPAPF